MYYYNWRLTGDGLLPPRLLSRIQYEVAPYFVWESPRPAPAYRHRVILRPEAEIQGVTADEAVARILATVDVPR